MPHRNLPFVKENYYHLYSRGNRKERIFFEDANYIRFLEKIEEYRVKYAVAVVAYSLLSNHFHLLLKQNSEIPISKFMAVLLNSYARYAAVRYELPTGHFFQGRFGSRLIESEEGLLQNSRYIHLNNIKDKILGIDITYRKDRNLCLYKKLIEELRNYPWSSYQTYLRLRPSSSPVSIETNLILNLENRISYRKFVEAKISDEDIWALETNF